ncbi:MAG: CoA-binding protein [Pseudomonadota bacterium]
MRRILRETRMIAMVGASDNPARPSYFVLKYLLEKGYVVFPVNPRLAGSEIHGQLVFADLESIEAPIDMVDVFRPSEAAPAIAGEAVVIGARVLWLQLGVISEEAARIADAGGLAVVMDRCPKIEYGRLSGEVGWMGVNSRTISAKRGGMLGGYQRRRIT